MIKGILIAVGILGSVAFALFVWACCKAAGDADKQMGYDYLTEEDWEVM